MNRAVLPVFLLFPLLAAETLAYGERLLVGQNKMYQKPCQAIAAAKAGDEIVVDAGSYPGDTCAWSTDNLTIRAVGGRAKIDLSGTPPAQKKGIFTILAPSATVEGFEFSGAKISVADGNNGAGIRHQGLNLTVKDCSFHDNQNGILSAPPMAKSGEILIETSEFYKNGVGDGLTHNIYIGNSARFTLRYSYSHHANVGHLVKSRAAVNEILYNRLTDEPGTTASYEVDLSNAGATYIIGNLIEQSAESQNSAIISYGAEGVPAGWDSQLFVVNNTILNTRKIGIFVANRTTTSAVIVNNILWNGGDVTSNKNDKTTNNWQSSMGDPRFVDVTKYNVRLQDGSPCINAGQDPGMGNGRSLVPTSHYEHPARFSPRTRIGTAFETGAYEFGVDPTPDGATPDGGPPGGMDPGCSCRVHRKGELGLGWFAAVTALALLPLRSRLRKRSYQRMC